MVAGFRCTLVELRLRRTHHHHSAHLSSALSTLPVFALNAKTRDRSSVDPEHSILARKSL